MHFIRGRNVFDAIGNLMVSHKKVARLMIPTFWNLIDHACAKGMNPYHLFVHGALIGKTRRFKSIRYHAKGRTGR
jgi:ribosomal protein L22